MMIPISKPTVGQDAIDAVVSLLQAGRLAEGEEVHQFENRFSELYGRRAVATSNGTSALHVALLAAGVKPGDFVITTPFSFIATANAILYCGATPIFVDIDSDTFNIPPDSIRKALKKYPHAKYLLIVHLFGNPCDMDEIMQIVESDHITLIEDCAQAHLATWKNKLVGTFGKTAAFSFYPTKNMTTGEGGMVLSADAETHHHANLLVHHGAEVRYQHQMLGYNYRMTDISAAIGNSQLNELEANTAKRIQNAKYYTENLELPGCRVPVADTYSKHVYHQYTLEVENRDAFVHYLTTNGIGHGIYYPDLMCDFPYMKEKSMTELIPVSREMANKVVSIPVHPKLTQEDLDYIIEKTKMFFLPVKTR